MTPAITNANAYDARAYARAASLQRWPEVLAPFGEGGGFSLGDQAIETEKCQKSTFISAYLSMFVSAIHCRCCALDFQEHEFGFVIYLLKATCKPF